jgi:hypothetical protein
MSPTRIDFLSLPLHKELAKGTLKNILTDAGISVDELLACL